MGKFLLLPLIAIIGFCTAGTRVARSIDLSAAHSLISDSRLPGEITPNNYTIELRPNIDEATFSGKIKIVMTVQEPTNQITLHAAHEVEVAESDIKLSKIGMDETWEMSNCNTTDWTNLSFSSIHQDPLTNDFPKEIPIRRVDRMIKKPLLVIHLQNALKQGTVAELEIDFNGQIWESSEGMFKGSYPDISGEKKWGALVVKFKDFF